jgi:tetrahydromethanopterin S-methyltransferase subunit F
MFWVIHILIGMIIGIVFNSPLLIIPIALLSHFILDAIPHWDSVFDKIEFIKNGKTKIKKLDVFMKFFDIFLSIFIVFHFFKYYNKTTKIFLGIFASLLPDLLKIGYLTRIKNNKYYISYLKFHAKIQKDINWKKGIFIQLILLIILFIILYLLY